MVFIFLRSLVYNVLFYLTLAFWLIVGIPTFLMPRSGILTVARYWACSSIWLLRVVCNIRVEYRGLEKIPKGPLIVASKHQSMWETFALLQMARRAGEQVRRGRQLIIFPEGTRTPVGAAPHYKTGVAQIYVDCGVACVPVALNSGLFWPRRTFMRYPGTLVVEFLDPLPPGLSRREFIAQISTVIEDATNRLVEVGRREQALLFDRAPGSASVKA